jgi:hypothetical protein
MLELLTGAGLSAAAGLNAYIPLLLLGLSSRFLDGVQLPAAWAWLENDGVLVVLAVLLLLEIVADKIPVVDTVNDWLQTVVRPASGGIVFVSGVASKTVAVADPASFFASNQWIPIAIGVLLALTVHVGKTISRPAANAVTFGLAAPVLSGLEDLASVVMSVLALLFPILVMVALAGLALAGVAVVRRRRRRREAKFRATPVPDRPRTP